MSVAEAEFTPEEIDAKLAEIGLSGRVIVRVDEICDIFGCSRSHYYKTLALELGHLIISEKVVGCYARNIARLLLRRERNPASVRVRRRKKA